MCKWGETTDVKVWIPAELSHDGKARWAMKPLDNCIVDIVKGLNNMGVYTIGSCCGHGKGDGEIFLEDGRELIVRQRKDN